MTDAPDTEGHSGTPVAATPTSPALRKPQPSTEALVDKVLATGQTPVARPKRKLAVTAAELQAERDGFLPCWVRSPKSGLEFYTGFSRSKLYELAGDGKIRSVSIREPGQVKGVRLFHLASILDFIARCEAAQVAESDAKKRQGDGQ